MDEQTALLLGAAIGVAPGLLTSVIQLGSTWINRRGDLRRAAYADRLERYEAFVEVLQQIDGQLRQTLARNMRGGGFRDRVDLEPALFAKLGQATARAALNAPSALAALVVELHDELISELEVELEVGSDKGRFVDPDKLRRVRDLMKVDLESMPGA